MLLPAAKGLAPVNAPNPPPLTLPVTLDEGILSAAPSVRAAAALVKEAYTVTAPTAGFNVQLVFTVTGTLPFAVPFGTSAKFTRPGAAVTVSEVVRPAARLTPAILELSCARAGATDRSIPSMAMAGIASRHSFAGTAFLVELAANMNTVIRLLLS